MLADFQRLYPTGCLTSELVQIYNGKYIIRAIIEIEGKTRATGMAASESLEEAEDKARERAIMVLPVTVLPITNVVPQSQVELQVETVIESQVEAPVETKNGLKKDQDEMAKDVASVTSVRAGNHPEQTAPQLELQEIIPAPEPTLEKSTTNSKQKKTSRSEPIEPVSTSNSQPDIFSPSEIPQSQSQPQPQPIPTPSIPPEVIAATDTREVEVIMEEFDYPDIPPFDSVESIDSVESKPSEPVLEFDQFAQTNQTNLNQANQFGQANQFDQPIYPDNVTPLVAPNPVAEAEPSSKPKAEPKAEPKASTAKRGRKKNEPVDLSGIIAETDVEMQRLGWTPEQGREHLIQTYKKRGRTLLSEDELIDFLNYLKAQPTPSASFAIDPLDF